MKLLKLEIFPIALCVILMHIGVISAQSSSTSPSTNTTTTNIITLSANGTTKLSTGIPTTVSSTLNVTTTAAPSVMNQTSSAVNATTAASSSTNQTSSAVNATTAPPSATNETSSASTKPSATSQIGTTTTGTNLTTTTPPSTASPNPKTIGAAPVPSGRLCEDGNDKVGFDLGCDCRLMKNVAVADCSNRKIKIGSKYIPLPDKLNVSSQVRTLDLSSNVLKSIGENTFQEVSGVTDLILSNNEIVAVEHLHFPMLSHLDLSFNKMTNLSSHVFSHANKLHYLDLSHNSLTFIDPEAFSGLKSLQTLKLAYNPLENELNYMEVYPFILNNMTYLEELDLTNTSIPNLPEFAINGTTNLKRLILKNNYLYFLPEGAFSQLTQLEELDISGNHFTRLRAYDFAGLHNLRKLVVNNGRALQRIDAYAFAGLSNLQTLQCEKNFHLSEIDSQAFRGNPDTNTSDSNPVVVQLGYNNLNHFEYSLLQWDTLEELELYGNPWICDCNLQWISYFIRKAPVNANILIDTDFKCSAPDHLKGIPFVELEPEELQCDSQVAVLAGVIALTIFVFVLILFVITLTMYHFQVLPQWAENWIGHLRNRSSLPKYQKVQVPKPSGRRNARLATGRHNPEVPPDLDWDTADVGNAGY